jgi:hypothetical protein
MLAAKALAEAQRQAAHARGAAWAAALADRAAVGSVAWHEGRLEVPGGVGAFGKTTWAVRHAVFSRGDHALELFEPGDPAVLARHALRPGSAAVKGKVGLGWRVEFRAETAGAAPEGAAASSSASSSEAACRDADASRRETPAAGLRFQASSMLDALAWCAVINGKAAAHALELRAGRAGDADQAADHAAAAAARQLQVAVWDAAGRGRAREAEGWFEGRLEVQGSLPGEGWASRCAVFNRVARTLELFPADVATHGGEPVSCLEV